MSEQNQTKPTPPANAVGIKGNNWIGSDGNVVEDTQNVGKNPNTDYDLSGWENGKKL